MDIKKFSWIYLWDVDFYYKAFLLDNKELWGGSQCSWNKAQLGLKTSANLAELSVIETVQNVTKREVKDIEALHVARKHLHGTHSQGCPSQMKSVFSHRSCKQGEDRSYSTPLAPLRHHLPQDQIIHQECERSVFFLCLVSDESGCFRVTKESDIITVLLMMVCFRTPGWKML